MSHIVHIHNIKIHRYVYDIEMVDGMMNPPNIRGIR